MVLSDIMMPGGVSGLNSPARSGDGNSPGTPVILTTGYVEAAAEMKYGEFPLRRSSHSVSKRWRMPGVSGQPKVYASCPTERSPVQ